MSVVGADRACSVRTFPFDTGVTDPVQRVRAAGLGDAAADLVLGGNTAVLTLLPISTPEPQPRTTA